MSSAHRPWWLLVNQPPGLITTLEEQATPAERGWVITGQPLVQGLAWLTCGPVSALLVIAVLVGAAIVMKATEMPAIAKAGFIAAFLALPALAWGVTIVLANKLSAPHLAAIRQAQTRRATIRWDRGLGQLLYSSDSASEQRLDFSQMRRVYAAPGIGARDVSQVCLVVETDFGPVILLNEALGSPAQKAALAEALEIERQNYARQQKTPLG